jgi:DNA-binding response OmpR family regulator
MDTTATILVVDDEPYLLQFISQTLNRAGYQVLTAGDGLEALDILKTQPVHLILADIMMPRMNGYQLYERLVENPQWVKIPFLFLSGRAQDSDVRYGKELGVDDYLTKPFNIEDLLAAVRGKLRRAQQRAEAAAQPAAPSSREARTMALGQLRIDPGGHRAWLNGHTLHLSAREFKLLECLARRRDEVVPLPELIQVTHGLQADYAEASGLLRPLVRSLRRKLGYSAGEFGCIQSVRGIGYQLIPPAD